MSERCGKKALIVVCMSYESYMVEDGSITLYGRAEGRTCSVFLVMYVCTAVKCIQICVERDPCRTRTDIC